MGYSLYIGSLWAFQLHHGQTRVFVIVAGGVLGFCAGLLWTAQGSIMMSYPEEKDKGRAFSVFWSIFTMGGVVGSVIALGVSVRDGKGLEVNTAVYLAFVILMIIAIFVCWLILPPNYVVRGDGTLVELQAQMSVKQELRAFAAQFKDINMLLLFPMFFTSNYFYAYQGSIVARMFSGRTRALSSLLGNLGAVIGAIIIGLVLDRMPGGRRQRAVIGWCWTLFFMCAVWGGGIAFQTKFKRDKDSIGWDYTDAESRSPLALMFSYYVVDSFYQGLAYYVMSALANNPFELARMAGYYKGVQSAGAAISYGMDAVATPYLTEVIVSFVIMLFSLPLCLIVILKIKETNNTEENTIHVENLTEGNLHHAALPKGHHAAHDEFDEEKAAQLHTEELRH